MKRFKNILYIIEDDLDEDSVTEKVINLARLNDAEVLVTRIPKESYFDAFSQVFPERMRELDSVLKEHDQTAIDRVVNDGRWGDVHVSGSLIPGRGFISVVQQVLRANHDLVIKGGKLDEGVDQLAMRLIRKCPCPVWVIRKTHTGDFRRILAAVDIGAENEETNALNKKIVQLASSLAQREKGEAHYMHSWRLEFEMMMHGPRMNIKPEELFEFKKTLRLQRETGLQRLLEQSNINPLTGNVHLIEGDTRVVIQDLLERLQIDVLVMGTIGRSGIPGLLIGNMAEKILSKINCTVLAVKPDDFVSPVTL
jgi:nucleotide-binding universal stress UspA family protein